MVDNNGEFILQSAPTPASVPTPDADEDPQAPEIPDADADVEEEPYEEEDLTPRDGDILQAGDHFIELETRPYPQEMLVEGLRRRGFTEILLDQNPEQIARKTLARKQRFLGRLSRPIIVHQQPRDRWTYVRRLNTNVWSNPKLKFCDYQLIKNHLYETRFLSRMRSTPTRPMVEDDLDQMGWDVLHLSALRRDMRIPGRDTTSVTLWFAILRWDEADSYVSEDDPFYFEDVKGIATR